MTSLPLAWSFLFYNAAEYLLFGLSDSAQTAVPKLICIDIVIIEYIEN